MFKGNHRAIDIYRVVFFFAFLMVAWGRAHAACPPQRAVPARIPASEANKARALVLFKAGNNLLEGKDYEGALDLFLQSRALWSRPSNTKNAAICLLELGRYPEALAFYEEILSEFQSDIDPAEQDAIAEKVRELKEKIAIVRVVGDDGSLVIDGEACGSLPRSVPIYLMPGSHVVQVSRDNEPDWFEQISAKASSVMTVKVAPPVNGKWFIQAFGGPAWGLSGIGFNDEVPLQSISGFLIHARGGYRLPSGFSLALASGLLYVESAFPTTRVTFDNVDRRYEVNRSVPTFAPFMGGSAGWDKRLNKRFDMWIRTGVGLLAAQSGDIVDAQIRRASTGGDELGVIIDGRRIVRSVPAYATLDLGVAMRFGSLTIGLSLGSLLFFVNGPRLPMIRLAPRALGQTITDGNCQEGALKTDVDCIPALALSSRPISYRPTYLFIPQIAFAFDP